MGQERVRRPLYADEFGNIRVTTSTAASTALAPRGVISLATTSTGAPVVYTLAQLPKKGKRFAICAATLASSSVGPFHVNAAANSFLGSSSQEMLTLPVAGNGAEFIGLSTTRWLCIGTNGGTFSTST